MQVRAFERYDSLIEIQIMRSILSFSLTSEWQSSCKFQKADSPKLLIAFA